MLPGQNLEFMLLNCCFEVELIWTPTAT